MNGTSVGRRVPALTIERYSDQLMLALNKTNGLQYLQALRKQRSKLVVQRGEFVPEEDRLDMEVEIIQKRKDEIEKSTATPISKMKSLKTKSELKRKPSKIELGDSMVLKKSTKLRIISKVRMVGRMALVIKNYRQESEEKLRKERLNARWELVRRIARASLSLRSIKFAAVTTDSSTFNNYPRFQRLLKNPPADRNSADLQFLAAEIDTLKFFKNLDIPLVDKIQIAKRMEYHLVPTRGNTLFRQDDIGDYFYVIASGSLSVRVRDMVDKHEPIPPATFNTSAPSFRSRKVSSKMSDLEFSKTVAILVAGEGFGGISIRAQDHGRRKASVIAEERSELIQLHADDYRELILKHEDKKLLGPTQFLKSIRAFKAVEDTDLRDLALISYVKTYPIGSYIWEQSTPLNDLEYVGIIRMGRCKISKLVFKNGQEIPYTKYNMCNQTEDQIIEFEIGYKSIGNIITDLAALAVNTCRHHSASVIADTCVEICFLPKHAVNYALRKGTSRLQFQQFLSSYPNEMKTKAFVEEIQDWKRFQGKFVRSVLLETERGRNIIDIMDRQQEETNEARLQTLKELRYANRQARKQIIQSKTNETRPAVLSLQ